MGLSHKRGLTSTCWARKVEKLERLYNYEFLSFKGRKVEVSHRSEEQIEADLKIDIASPRMSRKCLYTVFRLDVAVYSSRA